MTPREKMATILAERPLRPTIHDSTASRIRSGDPVACRALAQELKHATRATVAKRLGIGLRTLTRYISSVPELRKQMGLA